jgi:hypothetical protein
MLEKFGDVFEASQMRCHDPTHSRILKLDKYRMKEVIFRSLKWTIGFSKNNTIC